MEARWGGEFAATFLRGDGPRKRLLVAGLWESCVCGDASLVRVTYGVKEPSGESHFE